MSNEQKPKQLNVNKDTILAARTAIESGIEYARECLAEHDRSLGRTITKNKTWAETMEQDIKQMEQALQDLKPNAG